MLPLDETIYIPVSRARTGNPDDFTSSWTAELLWTDNANGVSPSGDIESISYDNDMGYIKVTSGSTEGNSIICLKNSSGTIVWSWHIWVTNYDPDTEANGTTYTITNTAGASYTFMDRNLGATSATPGDAGTIGLHYQWGRKDPFTASSSFSSNTETNIYNADGTGTSISTTTVNVDNNLKNSIENPDVFYENGILPYDWYTTSSSSQNNALWGGENLTTPSYKTIFDPCPAGWRVPAFKGGQSPWSALGDNGSSTSSVGTWENYGVTWTAITAGYWSAAGYRDYNDGSLSGVGSNGNYWSASPGPIGGFYLGFNSGGVYPTNGGNRALGLSVRCVKE
jgi:hypothetical protein